MKRDLNIVVYVGSMAHHRRWCGAFNAGLLRHGIQARIAEHDVPLDCDLAVFWAHRRANVMIHQRGAGRDYLVLEHGYIGDRLHQWSSAGFNGLNGRATFPPAYDGGVRWRKYFDGALKPWKEGGDYVLLIGQVPGDASIAHVNIDAWYDEVIATLHAAGKRVVFRPHPVAVRMGCKTVPVGAEIDRRPLAESLAGAEYVVTFSSNTGVDALLSGVPVVACDKGSMVWKTAGDAVDVFPGYPDRKYWAHEMAHKQWTEEEFSSGAAWEHLRRHYGQ